MNSILLLAGVGALGMVAVQLAMFVSQRSHNRTRDYDFLRNRHDHCEQTIDRVVDVARQNSVFRPAWKGWRQLRVTHTEMVSADCKTFVFEDVESCPMPSFIPGQFLMVGRVESGQSEPKVSRCYSLSSAPSPQHLQITVKRVDGGQVSPWLHDSVQVGDLIPARAPSGRFILDTQRNDLVVCLAAGIGITPMASMAHYIAKMQPGRRVIVFLSARDGAHCPMVHELRQLERSNPYVTLVVLCSRPQPGDAFDLKGRLTIDIIARIIQEPVGSYYLCGPMEFMTGLSDELIRWGVPEDSVSFESFGGGAPAPGVASQSDQAIPVHFQTSDKSLLFSAADNTLLDAAEKAGVSIDADCRAGACGTCLKKLLKGKVTYAQAPSYGPIADDECLPCVGQPAEETVIDA